MPALTSSPQTYRVFITVYKSPTPPDRADTRHAGLFFQSPGSNVMYHIVEDPRRGWKVDEYSHHNPAMNIGHVELGNISLVVDELHRLMKSVPLDQNPEPGTSNSQAWVDKALAVLKKEGYITDGDYNRAVNKMIDIALQDQE
ncbi:hypothetical protein NLG97_g2510 [Lecanicillium saksenae]|uniref:Uncharacterized protein n=1 Tax=Lecanicillium saksenae TaxID=468837 RepID=A0ACC1R3D6_9HYPO|nr:hypothetical protein NLG97_g2510 [Lecanicillium saksenae]